MEECVRHERGRWVHYRDRHRPLPPETRVYVAGLLPLIGQGGAPRGGDI